MLCRLTPLDAVCTLARRNYATVVQRGRWEWEWEWEGNGNNAAREMIQNGATAMLQNLASK